MQEMLRRLATTRALLIAAIAWSALNVALVFFYFGGQRVHRVETAGLILAGVALSHLARRQAWDQLSILPEPAWSSFAFTALGIWCVGAFAHLSFPFLSDDYVFLDAASGAKPWMFYRPLFERLMALLGSNDVVSPRPFHLVAFTLHVASAGLAGLLFNRLVAGGGGGWFVAGLVVLNPLQLEAVLWVAGLQELLWVGCTLMALWIYTGSATLHPVRALLTVLAAAAALASKETAICVVLLLAGADLLMGRRQRVQIAVYLALAALVAAYLWLRRQAGAATPLDGLFIDSGYQLKEFLVAPYRRLLLPLSAAVWEPPSAVVGAVGLMWLAAVGVALSLRRGARAILVGVAVIVITTLPLQRYLFVSAVLEHARYLYFPAIGWAAVVVGLLDGVSRSPRARIAAAALILVTAAVLLKANLQPWQQAGSFVNALTSEILAGRDVRAFLERHERIHGWPADAASGLPASQDGVWLFQNGAEEFRLLVRSGRLVPQSNVP